MRPLVTCRIAVCLCLAVGTPALNGASALTQRVSPVMTMAPGFVTIRVNIEPSPDNRLLAVIVESSDYYRRSELELDGSQATRTNVFELRDLPSGVYQITSIVTGAHGTRTTATSLARVAPSAGH